MIVSIDDNLKVKKQFLQFMLEATIPDFDWGNYDYNYWDGGFTYNHRINTSIIENKVAGIEILESGVEENEYFWSSEYIIFNYENSIYKINYTEGSHGYEYKLELDTLKSVTAKTKEVTYYE